MYGNPACAISPLSLHDALPIYEALGLPRPWDQQWSLRIQQVLAYETDVLEYPDIFEGSRVMEGLVAELLEDRKSTRLNSSHGSISYAVFCLKKKYRKACHRCAT